MLQKSRHVAKKTGGAAALPLKTDTENPYKNLRKTEYLRKPFAPHPHPLSIISYKKRKVCHKRSAKKFL
jgi:hypothetical protein